MQLTLEEFQIGLDAFRAERAQMLGVDPKAVTCDTGILMAMIHAMDVVVTAHDAAKASEKVKTPTGKLQFDKIEPTGKIAIVKDIFDKAYSEHHGTGTATDAAFKAVIDYLQPTVEKPVNTTISVEFGAKLWATATGQEYRAFEKCLAYPAKNAWVKLAQHILSVYPDAAEKL